jgi:ABC-type Fe3+ transport system permease subunit
MTGHFTTEIGRMRTQESLARAERYRLAQRATGRTESDTERPSWHRTLVWRKALQALALSVLFAVVGASAALARPADVGPGAGSGSVSTVPQVEIPVQAAPADFSIEIAGLVALIALIVTVTLGLMRRRMTAQAG